MIAVRSDFFTSSIESNNGKVMILGGGEPLMIGDTMIGALAVSGGTAAQDSELAEYGKEILKEVIECL